MEDAPAGSLFRLFEHSFQPCVEGSSDRIKGGHPRFVRGRAFERYTRSEKWEEVWVGLFFLLLLR